MKLKIKVKVLIPNMELPKVINKGEWVDLRSAEEIKLTGPRAETLRRRKRNTPNEDSFRDVNFEFTLIPLGIAMKLPEGYEAIIAPRSSSFKNYGIIQANSIGIIDNSYSGNSDEWMLPVISFKNITINKGDRVCQFRIQLSQKATIWQKIKWLLSSGIELEEVDDLNSNNRSGFGSTGIK